MVAGCGLRPLLDLLQSGSRGRPRCGGCGLRPLLDLLQSTRTFPTSTRCCGLRPLLDLLQSASARDSARTSCGLRPLLDLLQSPPGSTRPPRRCGLRPLLDLLQWEIDCVSGLLNRTADCGRFSICYSRRLQSVEPNKRRPLRIAAASRFATVHSCWGSPRRRKLRIAAASRFATVWEARRTTVNRPTADCGRFSICYSVMSTSRRTQSDNCGLRPLLDLLQWPLGLTRRSLANILRIAAASRFATVS